MRKMIQSGFSALSHLSKTCTVKFLAPTKSMSLNNMLFSLKESFFFHSDEDLQSEISSESPAIDLKMKLFY